MDSKLVGAVINFKWSEETYGLQELLTLGKLPVIIKFVDGFYQCNSEGDTIEKEQVVRIQCAGSQTRVIARDVKGRFVNLPKSESLMLQLLNNETFLPTFEIVDTNQWNTHVCLVESNNTLETLEILSCAEQLYFLGNCIDPAIEDYLSPLVITIPAYRDVRFVKATGLVKTTDKSWTHITNLYNEAAKYIIYDTSQIEKDIIHVYDRTDVTKGEDVNSFVEPSWSFNWKSGTRTSGSTSSETSTPNILQRSVSSKATYDNAKQVSFNDFSQSYVPKKVSEIQKSKPESQKLIRSPSTPASFGSIQSVTTNRKQLSDEVQTLSVRGVSDCLRFLKLDQHIFKFSEEQIDGEMLVHLDEDILVDDLNMSRLGARRLMMYAKKGWRPRAVVEENTYQEENDVRL